MINPKFKGALRAQSLRDLLAFPPPPPKLSRPGLANPSYAECATIARLAAVA